MAHKVLNLDLSKDPRGNPIVYGRVGDSDSQIVTVNVTKKLSKWDLSDYTIAFEGETSSGKTKVIDSENIVSTPEGLKQGTFDYLFPNKAFAVAGEYKRAYFSFVNGNSRDTTGDFKFVVLQNADLTAEEAETVISEYNKLIEELRSQQSLAIDEMNQNFSAAQERIVELESQIEQALIDFENGNFWTKEESFNKEETSANVIDQLIGNENVRRTVTLDFKGKISGSDVESPHYAKRTTSGTTGVTSLWKPSEFQVYFVQSWYDGINSVDGKYNQLSAENEGAITQQLYAFNLLEVLKRELGEKFFTLQGAAEIKDQVAILRNIVRASNSTVWGFGSGENGNRLYQRVFNRFSMAWQYSQSNSASTIQPLNIPIPDNNTHAHVMDDGYIYVLAYTDPSDTVKKSILSMDYVRLELTIEISANEFIESMIAAYHREMMKPVNILINDLVDRVEALEGGI